MSKVLPPQIRIKRVNHHNAKARLSWSLGVSESLGCDVCHKGKDGKIPLFAVTQGVTSYRVCRTHAWRSEFHLIGIPDSEVGKRVFKEGGGLLTLFKGEGRQRHDEG